MLLDASCMRGEVGWLVRRVGRLIRVWKRFDVVDLGTCMVACRYLCFVGGEYSFSAGVLIMDLAYTE